MSELPTGWTETRLSELSVPGPSWDPKKHVGEFDYIDIEAVDNANQMIGRPRRLQATEAPSRARVSVRNGDVLYSLVRPYLKNIAVVPAALDGAVASTAFCRVRPAQGIEPDYVFNYLRQDRLINALPTYGNSPPAARDDEFFEIPVPIAPSAEQKRIVDKLDELFSDLDAGVAALKRAQVNLKRYRASVLKAAVEGRLTAEWRLANPPTETGSELLARVLRERRQRWEAAQLGKFKASGKIPPKGWREKYVEPVAPDTSKLPVLPKGWCWTSADVAGDVLLGRQRAPQFLTGQWSRGYLRVANIKDDRIDFSDVETMDFDEVHFQKYRLAPGDILVSEGQSPELVGQSAIFRGHNQPLCFQKTLHRFRAVKGVTTPEFAQLVFRSHVRNGVFRAVASITTNIAHLTLEKFQASPFPLPPAAEQVKIVEMADAQLSSVDALDRSIVASFARGGALRQSILKQAFTGRLVPQDPDDEPASQLLERILAARAAAIAAPRAPRRRAQSSEAARAPTVAKRRKRSKG